MKEGVTLPPASYEENRAVIDPLVGQLRQRINAIGAANSPHAISDLGVADYVVVDGHPSIISVKPIVPSTDLVAQAPGTEYFHVVIKFLDQAFVDRIGVQYQLAAPRMITGYEAPSSSSVPITNAAGTIIAHLAWDPYRPGSAWSRNSAPTFSSHRSHGPGHGVVAPGSLAIGAGAPSPGVFTMR